MSSNSGLSAGTQVSTLAFVGPFVRGATPTKRVIASPAAAMPTGAHDAMMLARSFERYDKAAVDVTAVDAKERMEQIEEILESFVSQMVENAATPTKWLLDQPCVVGEYSCPARIGNYMHHFLNALMFAVVRNLPIAVRMSTKYAPHNCHDYLQRAAWMENATGVIARTCLARASSCSAGDAMQPDRTWSSASRFAWAERLACSSSHVLRLKPAYNDSVCGRANETILGLRTFGNERYDAQEVAALGLGPAARGGDARTTALFALGSQYLFGRLFHLSFRFHQDTVAAPIQAVLRSGNPKWPDRSAALYVSVHLRHRDFGQDGTEGVGMFAKAVRDAVQRRGAKRACIVLLASDRRASESAFAEALDGSSCAVVTIPRAPSGQNVSIDNSRDRADHGPDVGAVAMKDLALLSHGEILVTGFASTFGMLLCELVAGGSPERRAMQATPFAILCDQPGNFSQHCLDEMPLIGRSSWHQSLARWPKADLHTVSDDLGARCVPGLKT